MSNPAFSLVFVTWNAESEITRTLQSLVEQNFDDFEVIINDNASSDQTVGNVKEFTDELQITLIENDDNLGYSEGINLAASESGGEYIGIYNEDTYFPPEYLKTIYTTISSNAVWTTARENHRVSEDHLCVRMMSKYQFTIPYVVDSTSGVVESNFVPGDGAIIPREVYDSALGGSVFDSSLPLNAEDVELSIRLNNNDVPIYCILDTYSIHPDRGDLYSFSFENLRELFRVTRARYIASHYSRQPLLTQLIIISSFFTRPLFMLGPGFPVSEKTFIEKYGQRVMA